MKLKVEIKEAVDDRGNPQKAIYVQGNYFDWGVELDDLREAAVRSSNSPVVRKGIMGSLREHFVQSFSEFVRKEVTLKEIIDAIEAGEIEV